MIDADVFDFQAAVEETTLTGKRYTSIAVGGVAGGLLAWWLAPGESEGG